MSGWGGRRAGAGRKSCPLGMKKENINIRIDKASVATLEVLAMRFNCSKSEAVRRAIEMAWNESFTKEDGPRP